MLLAGIRQMANPAFTADSTFGIKDKAAETVVRELGFGNFAIGTLGALSLLNREWVVPAAIAGGCSMVWRERCTCAKPIATPTKHRHGLGPVHFPGSAPLSCRDDFQVSLVSNSSRWRSQI